MRQQLLLSAVLLALAAACGEPSPTSTDGAGGAGGAPPASAISCDAAALDLGTLVVGEQATRPLTCTLVGDGPLAIARAELTGEDATSFRVELAVGTPLEPGEPLALSVVLDATRPAGPRAATLRLVDDAGRARASIELSATVIPAALVLSHETGCDPALELGAVRPGEVAERTLAIENVSTAPRLLQRLTVEAGVEAGFRVGGGLPYVLQPGERFLARVRFAPTEPGRVSGSLRLESDDPAATVRELCVSGFGGGPVLRCDPARLEFGPQIVGHPTTREVTCTNEGTADPIGGSPLVIEAFAFDAPGFTAAPTTSVLPVTLAPGEAIELDVGWTPVAPGPVAALLTISSNDAAAPTLALTGTAEAFETCSFALRATALEFGSVDVGAELTLDVALRNEGATWCLVTGLRVEGEGASAFTLPDGDAPLRLAPFTEALVPIRFAPPTWQPRWQANVTMTIFGPVDPVTTVAVGGASVEACVRAEPAGIDFGDVALGCGSLDRRLELVNGCATPRTVTELLPAPGSNAAFMLAPWVAPPLTLAPGARTQIAATFDPGALATEHGALLLKVAEESAPHAIGLVGTGRLDGRRTDRFVIPPNDAVDVLFVLDTYRGLSEETLISEAHTSAFVDGLLARGIDARIGVITTGTGGCGGPSTRGALLPVDGSRPRILTSRTSGLAALLAQNFRVMGCPEGSDGLQTAADAVRFAATALAVDGEELLRRDAHLAVIFVSARDDQSPNTTIEYANELSTGKRGWYGVQVQALVGDGCLLESGARYVHVAERFGGGAFPLCSAELGWSATIEALADRIRLHRGSFVLHGVPDDVNQSGNLEVPEEISLAIDGSPAPQWDPAGREVWGYYGSLEIELGPGISAEVGTTLEATYTAYCF